MDAPSFRTEARVHEPKTLVFGKHGTGKTMFACQLATENLMKREIERLVLTRPIVGADEDMGYLPGEMERKMEPGSSFFT